MELHVGTPALTLNSSFYFALKEPGQKELCGMDTEPLCLLEKNRKKELRHPREDKSRVFVFLFSRLRFPEAPNISRRRKKKQRVER